jgi:uncharacterized protein YdeI (YjbR/CyaY-like superfamily)
MEITTTFYPKNRTAWRAWLKKHHATRREIWLMYYNKSSGKPRIPYNDAVEEALCFGWIDSIMKKIDAASFAQRFTPRKPKSVWSEMNKERVRRLIKEKKMTAAGLAAFNGSARRSVLKTGTSVRAQKLVIPPFILKALKRDAITWKNFQKFPESYKRIRIGWIEGARHRPKIFRQRLNYFLKMTALNKRYGMVQ